MDQQSSFFEKLNAFGVGRRKIVDNLFKDDQPPPRLGVYDTDDETLCHDVLETICNVPGCKFKCQTLLEFENHYNSSHRYTCLQCKKILPSPHLLDLHLQENHDSYFAVMAERKPSYCCYIEECKDKFMKQEERIEHCVKYHKLPKDFRFEHRPKNRKQVKKAKGIQEKMELDSVNTDKSIFYLKNSKNKTFKYTGRKFTNANQNKSTNDVDMDSMVNDFKKSLPD